MSLVIKESWVFLERRTYEVAELKWWSCRAVRDLQRASLSLPSAHHPLWKKKYMEEEEEEEEGENTARGKSQ